MTIQAAVGGQLRNVYYTILYYTLYIVGFSKTLLWTKLHASVGGQLRHVYYTKLSPIHFCEPNYKRHWETCIVRCSDTLYLLAENQPIYKLRFSSCYPCIYIVLLKCMTPWLGRTMFTIVDSIAVTLFTERSKKLLWIDAGSREPSYIAATSYKQWWEDNWAT